MKHLFLFASILAIVTSCSTSKLAKETSKKFRGNWEITNVDFVGIESNYVKATVFNQAEANCYIGSQWYFVANNNSGNYKIQSSESGCPNQEITNFKWFVEESQGNPFFFFKQIGEGLKAKEVKNGYRLQVISSTDTQLILSQNIPFEGKNISINYTFQKIQQ